MIKKVWNVCTLLFCRDCKTVMYHSKKRSIYVTMKVRARGHERQPYQKIIRDCGFWYCCHFNLLIAYLTGRPGSRSSSPGRGKNFSLLYVIQTGSWEHPASYPMGDTAGVKRPRREADHSPPTSVEIKKTWVYTSTPPYVFIA
jgi:hypothetical protein